MDITTLAAANAYTNKKVAEGGGGGLPVVEFTTVPTAEGAALTEEEASIMTGLLANKMPIIAKFQDSAGFTHSATMPYIGAEGVAEMFQVMDIVTGVLNSATLVYVENAWIFMYGQAVSSS